MKASEMIEDLAIYPRNIVDDVWTGTLAHHLRNGAILPPVLVNKKDKRIVDGFHRRRAYIRVHGTDCEIPAEEMAFKTEAEMFLESMRRNGIHGKPLSTVDRIRCVSLGETLGLTVEVIAAVLHVEPIKLGATAVLRTAQGPAGEMVIMKRDMTRGNGQLSKEQKKAANAAFGKIALYAKLLFDLLNLNMLDLSQVGIAEDLYALRDLLNEKLPERVKEV